LRLSIDQVATVRSPCGTNVNATSAWLRIGRSKSSAMPTFDGAVASMIVILPAPALPSPSQA
jgi:hypothetical protein